MKRQGEASESSLNSFVWHIYGRDLLCRRWARCVRSERGSEHRVPGTDHRAPRAALGEAGARGQNSPCGPVGPGSGRCCGGGPQQIGSPRPPAPCRQTSRWQVSAGQRAICAARPTPHPHTGSPWQPRPGRRCPRPRAAVPVPPPGAAGQARPQQGPVCCAAGRAAGPGRSLPEFVPSGPP